MILKSKKTNEIYLHHGEDKYENLSTGGRGRIPDDVISNLMDKDEAMTNMAEKNPLLIDLVKAMGASIDESDS